MSACVKLRFWDWLIRVYWEYSVTFPSLNLYFSPREFLFQHVIYTDLSYLGTAVTEMRNLPSEVIFLFLNQNAQGPILLKISIWIERKQSLNTYMLTHSLLWIWMPFNGWFIINSRHLLNRFPRSNIFFCHPVTWIHLCFAQSHSEKQQIFNPGLNWSN